MLVINDVSVPFPSIQLEGFGGGLSADGENLFVIYHRGSLTGADYLPSVLLNIDLASGASTPVELPEQIGFPKSSALFINSQFVFIDHDKENDNTRLPDGNWQGGYLHASDTQGSMFRPLENGAGVTERIFWHDLKPVDEGLVALAFNYPDDSIFLLNSDFELISSLNMINVGSIAPISSGFVVSPYGGQNNRISFLDESLRVVKTVDLPQGDYAVHETHHLDSVDDQERILLIQEDNLSSHILLIDEVPIFLDKTDFDAVRSIFNFDLNQDGILDLVVNKNDTTEFYLNNGLGRLVEVSLPQMTDHFNIFPVQETLISMFWPSASVAMQILPVDEIDLRIPNQTDLWIEAIEFVDEGLVISFESEKQIHSLSSAFLNSELEIPSLSVPVDYQVLPNRFALKKSGSAENVAVFEFYDSQIDYEFHDSISVVSFRNTSISLDVQGSAGQTAKTLAAVIGEDGLSNKEYVGIGLQLFDAGQSLASVCELALTAVGATTNEAVVNLLYTNLYGEAPTADVAQPFIDALNNGGFTKGSLAAAAAELTDDLGVIDLVGLAETGVEYV